jgi:CHAT domain-containing protein/Tfp pilus assembly protein PilF
MQTAAIQRRSERETCRPAVRKALLALCALLVCGDISGFADPPSANKSAARTQAQRQYPALATFTARYLNNHAVLDAKLGRFALAERQFQEALAILKDLGEQDPVTAKYLTNLAELYQTMGQYSKAEPLLQQALAIRKKVLGDQHPDTASSLNILGTLYRSMGQYSKAEPLLQQALAIRKKVLGDQHPDTATSLNELALLYASMDQYSKAETLLRQALAIGKKVQGEHHPDTAADLTNLAAVYTSMGQYAKAESLFQQALAIRKKVVSEHDPKTASILNNLAGLYWSMGQYTKAEPLLQQALAIRKYALGEQHPDTGTSLNNLAALYTSMGQYAKAEPLYQRALVNSRRFLGERHPDTATILNNLAVLYWSMGQYTKAEPLVREALVSSQRLLVETFGILSEREQLAFEANSRSYLDSYLSVARTPESLAAAGAKAASDADVYRYVLLGKGIVTAQQAFIHLKLRRSELAPLFHELEQDGRRLQQLRFSPPAELGKRDAWRNEVQRLEEERNADQQKLAAESGEFRQLEESLQADAGQIKKLQALLPTNTALVDALEYTHFSPPLNKKGELIRERRLMAFIVRPDAGMKSGVKRIDLGPVAPIGRAIDEWRRVAAEPEKPRTDGWEHLQKLRSLVWNKLEPHLVGVETLLVSPDGPLCQFPLVALPGTKPDTYLIEERPLAIAVIPVPQLLSRLLAPALEHPVDNRPQSMLLVGDVAYDAPAGGDRGIGRSALRGPFSALPQLEHSRSEILAIEDSFKQRFKTNGSTRELRREEATESAFRSEAPRHRWLHLATHGFFAPPKLKSALTSYDRGPGGSESIARTASAGVDPNLLSGIALAGANRPAQPGEDDGILTALEISELDLSGVELAVLSACQTGLGETAGGEGVLGLQRAFQVAGAKSVLASLWEIPDLATSLLMQRFYENLWDKKMGKAQALAEAQLWMLKEGPSRGLDLAEPGQPALQSKRLLPKSWAAFVLSGDWR